MSAAPTELKKCVETNNPGLAPWAMQECRPKELVCIFITNQLSVDIDDDPLLFFHFYICYIKNKPPQK